MPKVETRGRPKAELDEDLIRELAKAQLTNVEIAQISGCEEKTITRRYGDRLRAWKDEGVGSVRRRLYMGAMGMLEGTNQTTSMIFFLKNYGGCADVTREERKPLEFGSLPTQIVTADLGTTGKPN